MKYVRESLDEMNQVPFSNQNRNQPISQQYPMNRLQYEDADKPSNYQFTEDDYIKCEACANPTHPQQFKHGVCKKCAGNGFWVDAFGKLHRDPYTDKKRKTDTEIRREYLEEKAKSRNIYESKGESKLRIGDIATDCGSNLIKILQIGRLSDLYPDWESDKELSKEDFSDDDLFYKTAVQDLGSDINGLFNYSPYENLNIGDVKYYPVDKYYNKRWRIDKYDPYIDVSDHDDWLLHQTDHDIYPDLY